MPRAWPASRTGPGTSEWAGLHSGSSGSSVLLDPGIQGTAQVERDLIFLGGGNWALLSIEQLPDTRNFRLRTA